MTLDANSEVYGVRWTGTAWVRMSAATGSWDTAASTSARKAMDVAYEQLTGRAMFIWGDNANDDEQLWRTWDGSISTLSGINTLTINAMNTRANWVRLVPRLPTLNELMYVVQDNGGPISTRRFGTARRLMFMRNTIAVPRMCKA